MNFVFSIMGYFPDLTGGAWMYASGLAEALTKRGHRVDVIVPMASPDLPGEESINGVHIIRLPRTSRQPGFIKKWRSDNYGMKQLINSGRWDKDVIFINHQAYMSGGFCHWQGPNRASIFHGPWGEEFKLTKQFDQQPPIRKFILSMTARWMHSMERKGLNHAASILTASRYAGEKACTTHGNWLSGFVNISAGTDYGRFSPAGETERVAIRKQYGIPDDSFLIASVRRLDKRMGLDMLVEGFIKACSKAPDRPMNLLIAGKGPQQEELEARIQASGMSERIRLAGFVSDEALPAFYSAADITVMPSLDLEGFGLSTIESLGCGTPVLASSSGANRETAGKLHSDLIFKSGDSDHLAEKIHSLVDREIPLPGPEACRAFAMEHFSWERSVELLENHYQHLA